MFLRVNWQYSSIGSDNGLAPTRRHAIFWTNDGKFTNAYKYLIRLQRLKHYGKK